MTKWTIVPVPLYRFRSPGPEVFFQRGFGEMVEMIIYAFVLRGEDQTLLIDSGLPVNFSALNGAVRTRKGPRAGFEPLGAPLPDRLSEMGVSPDPIIVSSFGPYAVGGVDRLEAPLYASQRGIRDLLTPEETALVHPLPPEHRSRLCGARAVNRVSNPVAGVHLIEVGVHHPASLAILVDTADGRVALADPVFVKENLTDGVALGAAEYAAGWHSMVRRLGGSADAILPIHDPDPSPLPVAAWHMSLRA